MPVLVLRSMYKNFLLPRGWHTLSVSFFSDVLTEGISSKAGELFELYTKEFELLWLYLGASYVRPI
jgi:hypothetical protein